MNGLSMFQVPSQALVYLRKREAETLAELDALDNKAISEESRTEAPSEAKQYALFLVKELGGIRRRMAEVLSQS